MALAGLIARERKRNKKKMYGSCKYLPYYGVTDGLNQYLCGHRGRSGCTGSQNVSFTF